MKKLRRKYEPYKIPRPVKLSEHKLAMEIVAREGKRISLPIGQVKETLKHTLDILAEKPLEQVIKLLVKHKAALLACFITCIAQTAFAQRRQDIQIMSAADRGRIESLLPQVEPGPIRDAIRDSDGIWYDRESMGVPVQAGPGRNAQNEFSETGRLGVMNGLALRTLRSTDISSDPWAPLPGGTLRSPNVSAVKLLVLPNRPDGSLYQFVYFKEELEGFTNPNATVTGFDLTFPVGTALLEFIAVNDLVNKQHYPAIIRARFRQADSWAVQSACPVRTAEECRQVIKYLRPNWRRDPQIFAFMHHLGGNRTVLKTRRDSTPGNPRFGTQPESVFTVTAKVDTLPPLPVDLVRDILTKVEFKESSGYEWQPGCPAPTTDEPLHIVPQFYDGPYISMDSVGCARCHEGVQISARRHDPSNRKIAWNGGSKEGIISVSHVEPSTLTNTPTSEVRPRKQWLDTGVIAKFEDDPIKFPKAVYRRVVVPTQERFK